MVGMSHDWNLARVAEVTGSRLLTEGDRTVSGFTTDTREVPQESIFVGISGERVDGGTLAGEAIKAGATAALISEAALQVLGSDSDSLPLIICEDTTAALAALGRASRERLSCPVIGITGSTGKTSTKDILGAIFASSASTFVSAGNRNTEIGMPLELLRIPEGTDAVVLEMAMRGEGQIAELTRIAKPDAGIIINVGPVHIETLGSIERVAAAKSELMAGLAPGSVVVVPAGDDLLAPYLRDDLDTVTFGPTGDCRIVEVNGRRLTLDLRGARHSIEVDFDQPHNRLNFLAAAALALSLGFELPDSLRVDFSGLRGQRRAFGREVVVIDDCYNANPMSMRAALADLAGESERRGGRMVAVLGDMLELGPDSSSHHRQIGVEAAALGVDVLITAGERSAAAAEAFGGRHLAAANADEAADALLSVLEEGDTVLVKASRGIGLEVVAQRVERDWV